MNTSRIQKLLTGLVISVVGLTMGLGGGAVAYGATPPAKSAATSVHGTKSHTTLAKHHKKGTKKHTKKHSQKKHRKASHKHQKHAARTHRA
jgi:hypothetical protein